MNRLEPFEVLPESFYQKPTIALAKALLGCILVNEAEDGSSSGIIVETEAYLGTRDRAAHGFNNRRTKRTEIMFGKPGHAYTHFMHTHCLINVVSGKEEQPESVLIRAVEPYSGIGTMLKRRPVKNLQNLTSGPGKLTQALGITMNNYGHPFWEAPLMIAKGKQPYDIAVGTRIGIDHSGEAKDYPYRFWVSGNKFVSK